MFDNDEFERWIAQASDTLNSAKMDYSNKSYNWCCFKDKNTAQEALDCAENICNFCISMRMKYE